MKAKSKTRKQKPLEKKELAFPLRDRAVLIGFPLAALLVILWAVAAISKRDQKIAIAEQVEKWRVQFHLNESQVSGLREIELEYHGDGNPFGNFHSHSAQEMQNHQEQLRRLLGEDGHAQSD
jgi:hypothetical protein